MKNLIILMFSFMSFTAFSSAIATQAELIGAVFSDQNFLETIKDYPVDEIKFKQEDEKIFTLTVNPGAIAYDGCTFSALVEVTYKRYAAGPASDGIRKVLKVSDVSAVCGWQ